MELVKQALVIETTGMKTAASQTNSNGFIPEENYWTVDRVVFSFHSSSG